MTYTQTDIHTSKLLWGCAVHAQVVQRFIAALPSPADRRAKLSAPVSDGREDKRKAPRQRFCLTYICYMNTYSTICVIIMGTRIHWPIDKCLHGRPTCACRSNHWNIVDGAGCLHESENFPWIIQNHCVYYPFPPSTDWLQLTGLVHDLGKLLALWGEPQWAVVGDTFPVGCKFSDQCVFPEFFEGNPDFNDPRFK